VLKNALTATTNDMLELNRGFIIIGMFEFNLMDTWLALTAQTVSDRLTTMVGLTCLSFFLMVTLHLIFVEYFISKTLNSNYEMFRRMHENLIPDFVINK
jgi:hypothetical protein